ncbi:rhomboid family intramembrane serine protease [Hydrogenophaga crocea]|uniref:Rhomboid family intramembrane serine protease n=1 Tax=Hydrogenophaga crocea TaxID=2716225 RepID=A0A6G8IJE6_9BURK|nr:rhomboid family intramembrane serine protease [Hydrogenophaga crocea]QIM53362.1 rhomboid family intramembrane serine protease [Hydrogenophaga crocea]
MEHEIVYPSNGRARRTVRVALYGCLAVVLPLLLLGARSGGATAAGLALGALLVWCSEWLIRRHLPARGEALLRLTRRGVVSPYFFGPTKRFSWGEIESATIEGNQQTPFLRLQLRPGPNRPGKRSRWRGLDPDRPHVSLQSIPWGDVSHLFEAIDQHLRSTQPMGLDTPQAPRARHELREARDFQQRLQDGKPVPWACAALIALNVLAWLALGLRGGGWTDVAPASLLAHGGNTTSSVQAGEWWRLLSATFLHGGLMHLALNMLGLWFAGSLLERIFGSRQFLLIYLASGLAGSVASLHFAAQSHVSVGASGAVFGVAGALIAAVLQHRATLPKAFSTQILGGFSVYLALSLVQGFARPGIDNAAHLGGLVAGLLIAWVLPERFDPQRYQAQRRSRMALVALAAALVLPAAAHLAPPAARNLAGEIAAIQALPDVAREYDAAMMALKQELAEVKAGRLSPLEADERSRTVHAPRMARVVERLERLMPDLPAPARERMVPLLTLARAMHESLAMASVVVNGVPVPADEARSRELQATMVRAAGEFKQQAERARQP